MDSPEIYSPRKKPKLSCKIKNKDDKDDSSNTQLAAEKRNFIKACKKVSYEAYRDIKKRFQLIYLPECINNTCIHSGRNVNIKQISQPAEQDLKTEIRSNTWFEALEICLICITSSQYLSANILKSIVEIMMNAHEDLENGYTIDYILKKCQHTLACHFNMHPPCVSKGIRDCYKSFLTSPMEDKEFSNRNQYHSNEGIVSYCFSRLSYDIMFESSDGALIEEQEIPTEIEGVKRLHWKKENLELFELLVRTERIERCMLVLQSLIYLLQTDLALWLSRKICGNSQMRSQKPLLSFILWKNNQVISDASVSVPLQCLEIMKTFAYFVHLQYPERHIKTMSLWINAVVQMFYITERHSGVDYPNTNAFCAAFTKAFYKIIQPLPNKSISRILDNLHPPLMRYLLGLDHIQRTLDTYENDILIIMTVCIEQNLLKKYPVGKQKPTYFSQSTVKQHKLLKYLYNKCSGLDCAIDVPEDVYQKLQLCDNNNQKPKDHVIDILFTTFFAYLETYSIKNFKELLDQYNGIENNDDPLSYEPYRVGEHFVKKYKSIIKSLQDLLVLGALNKKGDNAHSKILFSFINEYFS